MFKKKIYLIIVAVSVYVLAAFFAYFYFNSAKTTFVTYIPPKQLANGSLSFDKTLPKTQPCPLNGVLYSKQQEAWWQKHRPLGVMIENHVDARPQSGISFADVTYEAVAEGGITRTLDIYYCQDAPEIGPIRSARVYFISWLSEYGDYPLYSHVGGANQAGPADALGELSDTGWTGYNDLNQFSIGFPIYWRDYNRLGANVATEHTMYSTTSKLWQLGASRGLTNVDKNNVSWDTNFTPYTFKDDAALAVRPAAQTIHLEFWTGDPDYYVDWTYDKASNLYTRNNGGVPHLDKDTNQQLTAKNVVVLSMVQTHANDGYENNVHLLYQTIGTGKAKIFMDGKEILGTWKKASKTARTLLFDTNGNPVQFDRGHIWFEILPLDGVVQVQPTQ